MTDADKITNPQHFGSDPVDIRIRIRINPETRIRNTDHFLLSLDTLAEVCALRAQSRSTDRCLKQITELSSSMSYQRHHNVAVSGHKDQHSTSYSSSITRDDLTWKFVTLLCHPAYATAEYRAAIVQRRPMSAASE